MNFLEIVLAFIVPIVLVSLIMPFYIKALKKHNINQSVSEYALDEYKTKAKTPIMGGLVFVVMSFVSYVIINTHGFNNREVLFVLTSVLLFGFVGFLDDILIILRHNNEGLSPKTKLLMEFIFVIVVYFAFKDLIHYTIDIPFINGGVVITPLIYIPFMILLYLAESNAVNFTDGMDGLCAGVSFIALVPFFIICYVQKDFDLAKYVLCFMGSLIGYLFFNFHPAKIFMGDSGSLALGALFTSLSIILNKEIALFFIGGVFVWEMFCVCLQLTSVKLFKKRVFKYTPIHYAFSINGMKEVKVVLMFYTIGIILAIIGTFIGLH